MTGWYDVRERGGNIRTLWGKLFGQEKNLTTSGIARINLFLHVLFRMGAEGEIRKRIVERDVLEAVISLGSNLFYGTGLAACILVFRARKVAERRSKVLLVDAARLFKKGRNQNTLEPQHTEQIFAWYRDYQDVPGAARVVALDEIARNDWNLNIPRYVEPVASEETVTVGEALASLKTSLADAYAAEDRLRALLRQANLSSSDA